MFFSFLLSGKVAKNKNEKSSPFGLLSFLCKGYKKDIFAKVLTGFELSALCKH